jgi:hypothetical protein
VKADKTLETENNDGHDDSVEVNTIGTLMTLVILINFSYYLIYVNLSRRLHLFDDKKIIGMDRFYLNNSDVMRFELIYIFLI